MMDPEIYRGWRIEPYEVRGTVSFKVMPPEGGPLGNVSAVSLPSITAARRRVDRIIEKRAQHTARWR